MRQLTGHATGSAAKLVALLEGGEVSRAPSEPADWVCEEPAALRRPGGFGSAQPAPPIARLMAFLGRSVD